MQYCDLIANCAGIQDDARLRTKARSGRAKRIAEHAKISATEIVRMIAQDIHEVDASLLHTLSISVGWPHRPKDWDFLRRAGHGIVAVDGIGRVFGSAMWFPHGEDFATVGLVITNPHSSARKWQMAHGAGI